MRRNIKTLYNFDPPTTQDEVRAASLQFVRKLTDDAFESGIRSAPIEMIITPSIGYQGHGTSTHVFEEGAEWLKERLIT